MKKVLEWNKILTRLESGMRLRLNMVIAMLRRLSSGLMNDVTCQ